MTPSVLCTQPQGSELWITYHQASRANKQVTAQLVDVSDASRLFDLEDVIDYIFQQGFIDHKWRSVTWFEDRNDMRLKTCSTIQYLLASGAGNTPESALHLVVSDIPQADSPIWVQYEYLHSANQVTASQRVRLDLPSSKCERLAHLTNHIFAKGYLAAKMRPFVFWKGACGKRIEESVKLEDLFASNEGLCESKPLRLIIDYKEEAPACVCKEGVQTKKVHACQCQEQLHTKSVLACQCQEQVRTKNPHACQCQGAHTSKETVPYSDAAQCRNAVQYRDAVQHRDAAQYRDVQHRDAVEHRDAAQFRDTVQFRDAAQHRDAVQFRDVQHRDAMQFRDAVQSRDATVCNCKH